MLQVGDKVRVRRYKDLVNEFGKRRLFGSDIINCKQERNFVIPEMLDTCGKIYTVIGIYSQEVWLKGVGRWVFTTNMLEDPNTGKAVSIA